MTTLSMRGDPPSVWSRMTAKRTPAGPLAGRQRSEQEDVFWEFVVAVARQHGRLRSSSILRSIDATRPAATAPSGAPPRRG